MIVNRGYLDYMQSWFNKGMDKTITVLYYTTSTSYGNVVQSGCTYTTYTGALWPMTTEERMEPGKATEFSGWKLALPHSACISASCDVLIDSTRYNVRFSDDAKSHKALIVVDLERA